MVQFAALIMKVFSMLFLIHYVVAIDLEMIRLQDQEVHLADFPGVFPSGDQLAEIPGNQLIMSGAEPGSGQQQQQQQTWLKRPKAPLLADGGNAQCNNGAESIPEQTFTPRRFRRSSAQHAKRQSKNFCTVPGLQKLQNGEEIPINPEKKGAEVGPADSGYPGISLPIVQNIIMRTRMWGSISQEPHEGVCGPVMVPICVPMLPKRKYPLQQQAFSHFVVPVRFCKFLFIVDFSNITLPSFYFILKIAEERILGDMFRTKL